MTALAIGALLLAAAPLAASPRQCPDVDPTRGYRLTARADAPAADSAWLTAVARSAAYRWKVPSARRNQYDGWDRVRQRLLPPEPRWADDWSPEARHRAELRLVLFADPARARAELATRSGDGRFDRSLETIVGDPMPGAPPMSTLPPGLGADSVVVTLAFGDTSHVAPQGVVHFAAVQTRAELVPNTLRVLPPAGHAGQFPATTVKYDVLATGLVDPASVEFLRGRGGQFDEAIRAGLRGARFRAPTSNCRPVAQTVVQTFGR